MKTKSEINKLALMLTRKISASTTPEQLRIVVSRRLEASKTELTETELAFLMHIAQQHVARNGKLGDENGHD